MALLVNINRSKKTRPAKPSDFNPFIKQIAAQKRITKSQFADALAVFVGAERLKELREKGVLKDAYA